MEAKQTTKQLRGALCICAAGCLWGTVGLFVHLLDGYGLSAGAMVFLRMSLGALAGIPLVAMRGLGRLRIGLRGVALCAVMGVFSGALFNYAYTLAIGEIGVATAAVLLYTSPVFVCLMSRLFFRERIGGQKVAGLALNILGCMLTVTGGHLAVLGFSLRGVCLGITAGFLYSLLTILGVVGQDYDAMARSFYTFAFGAIFMAVMAHPWQELAACSDLRMWLTALGYGICSTTGAYAIYLKGLASGLAPSKAPVLASVETVVAAVIGIAVLHEAAGLWKLIGIALVLVSIAVMNLERGQERGETHQQA